MEIRYYNKMNKRSKEQVMKQQHPQYAFNDVIDCIKYNAAFPDNDVEIAKNTIYIKKSTL